MILVSSILIAAAFLILSWDNDDTWKVIACTAIIIFAITTMRLSVSISAYNDGYKDALCDVYKGIDNAKNASVDIPEFCDDKPL